MIHIPELVIEYGVAGSADEGGVVYTDSDWASCRGPEGAAWAHCEDVVGDAGARRAIASRGRRIHHYTSRPRKLGRSAVVGKGFRPSFDPMHRRLEGPPPEKGAGVTKHVEIREAEIREAIAARGFVPKRVPQECKIADVLKHPVTSSAFVQAGARHGLRLVTAAWPGSWKDRGPREVLDRDHTHTMIRIPRIACMPCRTPPGAQQGARRICVLRARRTKERSQPRGQVWELFMFWAADEGEGDENCIHLGRPD